MFFSFLQFNILMRSSWYCKTLSTQVMFENVWRCLSAPVWGWGVVEHCLSLHTLLSWLGPGQGEVSSPSLSPGLCTASGSPRSMSWIGLSGLPRFRSFSRSISISGSGVSHFRSRVCCPSPHVAEHDDHWPQADHSGHGPAGDWHDLDWDSSPGHWAPAGEHCLSLLLTPAPHVAEHWDQGDHWDHTSHAPASHCSSSVSGPTQLSRVRALHFLFRFLLPAPHDTEHGDHSSQPLQP